MVILRLSMKAFPEKQLEYRQTLVSIARLIEKEKGCLSCVTFYNLDTENHFCLLGEWRNRLDLDNHIKSRLFGVLLGTKTLLMEAIKIKVFTVSSLEELPDGRHPRPMKPW
jgi:quinol monooxygenase YgiN